MAARNILGARRAKRIHDILIELEDEIDKVESLMPVAFEKAYNLREEEDEDLEILRRLINCIGSAEYTLEWMYNNNFVK